MVHLPQDSPIKFKLALIVHLPGSSAPSGYAAWAASMADSAANAAAAEARAAAPHKPAPQQGQGSPAASSQPGSAAGASPPGSQTGSAPAAGTQQQQPRQQQQSQQQQLQAVSGVSVRGWWAGPGAAVPSFEEARTVWQQYVEMAGACGRSCVRAHLCKCEQPELCLHFLKLN